MITWEGRFGGSQTRKPLAMLEKPTVALLRQQGVEAAPMNNPEPKLYQDPPALERGQRTLDFPVVQPPTSQTSSTTTPAATPEQLTAPTDSMHATPSKSTPEVVDVESDSDSSEEPQSEERQTEKRKGRKREKDFNASPPKVLQKVHR